ncbi:hypothetical protein LDC_0866 [sediment metagenome]|uniref:Uncharacterized protein n=1 Tax=sediment metagenome TaxID=749907 RepID=D9PH66_9ZZZZ
MTTPTLNLSRIIKLGDNINENILNCIVYKMKDGVYFIPEIQFKGHIAQILQNEDIVPQLTGFYASIDDYDKLLLDKRIIVEQYQLKDPTVPDNLIDLVF